MGPSLLSARSGHSSCVIESDDGTTNSIIIIGGTTNELTTTTSEILNIKEQKWIPGPTIPYEIRKSACVSLPLVMNFTCLLIGGKIENDNDCSDILGLDKSLTKWTNLGKMSEARSGHLALPLS